MQKADFARLLQTSPWSRSAHFAVHHVANGPLAPRWPRQAAGTDNLSTGHDQKVADSVDNLPGAHWFGCVVPKRHAKRAVTRSLLKRAMRNVFGDHAERLPRGLWLVRLRSGFAAATFTSARSSALAAAASAELAVLLAPRLAQPSNPTPL